MDKYVYLTSSSYSGSTLLAFMMTAHPKIASISEMYPMVDETGLATYSCSCGKLFRECEFWHRLKTHMRSIYPDFDLTNFGTDLAPLGSRFVDRLQVANVRSTFLSELRDVFFLFLPRHPTHVDAIMRRNSDLAHAILEMTNKDIFFDATKRPQRIKYLSRFFPRELRVIHLVKDGRGVFDSFKRYFPDMSDETAILAWKRVNQHAERALRHVDDKRRFFLSYRDLAQDPEATMKRLCEFIGVEFDKKCLDFRNTGHHILGNTKMRLGSSTDIYYDEKWRDSLKEDQLQLFERLAGNLNRKYGFN